MKINERRLADASCSIIIPCFSPGNDDSAEPIAKDTEACTLMNLFYSRLADEALSFVKGSHCRVRRYTLSYRIIKSCDSELKIEIMLSARVLEENGRITTRRRSLTQIWRDGALISHSVFEI